MNIAVKVVAAGRLGQDRAAVLPRRGGYMFVLADGAGGTAGGADAAEAIIASAKRFAQSVELDPVHLLETLDRQLCSVGQSTAVIALVSQNQIWGASVEDSGAWLDLTAEQQRKPLLGSGGAMPLAFGPYPWIPRLLLGTDGLFNYVLPERIRQLATSLPVESAAVALIDAARLPSGALQDDIALILAE
jgi:serine/threonine protein phosphatase PrpC